MLRLWSGAVKKPVIMLTTLPGALKGQCSFLMRAVCVLPSVDVPGLGK